MTHEEAAAWVSSLKPGDVVARRYCGDMSLVIIKKVTPTGIVQTNEGYSFKLSSYCGHVFSYGSHYYNGEIVPATDELLSIIDKQKVISRARHFMSSARGLNYEFAKDLLDLCEWHGIDV